MKIELVVVLLNATVVFQLDVDSDKLIARLWCAILIDWPDFDLGERCVYII